MPEHATQSTTTTIKNPGWFWVMTAIVFPTAGAVITALVFLYGNFSTTKDAQGMESQIAEFKTEVRSQVSVMRDDQKDIKAENLRLRAEVRDELRELRGLVLELVKRMPKKYSSLNLDGLDGDAGSPLLKQAKSTNL